jgi:hypothetical protein
MRIDSDDPAVNEALTALLRTVRRAGGNGHDRARVVVRAGDLCLHAEGEDFGDARLLAIPDVCLPPITRFTLDLHGDDLVLVHAPDDLPAVSVTALRQLLDVYNACGKLAAWRVANPWCALAADPELRTALADLRAGAPKVEQQRAFADAGDTTVLAVRSFLGGRTFNLKPRAETAAEQGHAAAVGEGGDEVPVLAPFVDALNHDNRARSFGLTIDSDAVRRLWTHVDRPVTHSTECRVRYAPMDAVDAYLGYAFVDDSAPFLRSVPVTLQFADGAVLDVGALGGAPFQGRLPAEVASDRVYVPPITDSLRAGHLAVARLTIPGHRHAPALRRVLAFLLDAMQPGASEAYLRAAVADAEAQVLNANRQRIAAINGLVAAARAHDPPNAPAGRAAALDSVARLMARMRAHLDAYAHAMGID